jgi:hypothetical protein
MKKIIILERQKAPFEDNPYFLRELNEPLPLFYVQLQRLARYEKDDYPLKAKSAF